jgi:hypothetical protein
VIVDPAFFAPTRTPSIAPSNCDVTLPVSETIEEEACDNASPAMASPIMQRSVSLLMARLFSVEEFMMLLARFETIRQTPAYVKKPVGVLVRGEF